MRRAVVVAALRQSSALGSSLTQPQAAPCEAVQAVRLAIAAESPFFFRADGVEEEEEEAEEAAADAAQEEEAQPAPDAEQSVRGWLMDERRARQHRAEAAAAEAGEGGGAAAAVEPAQPPALEPSMNELRAKERRRGAARGRDGSGALAQPEGEAAAGKRNRSAPPVSALPYDFSTARAILPHGGGASLARRAGEAGGGGEKRRGGAWAFGGEMDAPVVEPYKPGRKSMALLKPKTVTFSAKR